MTRSEKRQKTGIIALRLTPGERVRLQAAAEAAGISLSRLDRESAINRAVAVLAEGEQ